MRQFNKERKKATRTQPRSVLISTLGAIHALAVDHIYEHTSTQHVNLTDTNEFVRQRLKVDENSDIHDKLNVAIALAKDTSMSDLANDLTALQHSQPCHDSSGNECEKWPEELRQVMLQHLNIGHKVTLSKPNVNTLGNYISANLLLLDCLRVESYSSRELREEVLDNFLLPTDKIVSYLLNI